jgi:hypothetical protein
MAAAVFAHLLEHPAAEAWGSIPEAQASGRARLMP